MAGEGNFAARLTALLLKGAGAEGTKIAVGVQTTVAAADTIATGLDSVTAVIVTLEDDPVAGAATATGVPSATAGSIVIKTWNSSFAAGTTFGKRVSWIAIGR